MSYFDTLNRFRVKISQSPKTITLTSVNRFKKCPKNKIKAKLRKDGKISVTTDYAKYKKVKEKFGELLTEVKNDCENPGNGGSTNIGRNKTSGSSESNDGTKKKGFGSAVTGIFHSPGRDKSAPDGRGETSDSDPVAPKNS